MSYAKMNSLLKSLGCAAVVAGVSVSANADQADYVSTVLNNENLISYYRFSEDPGETTTATDESDNDHHGTYSGSPVATTGPTADDGVASFGDDNPAVNFNGKGMLVLDPAPLDKERITFTGYIQTSHTEAVDGGQRIYTTTRGANHQFTINIVDGTTLTVTVQRGTDGWTAAHADLASAMDGEWHHLVVSRGGNDWSDVKIWLDFEPVETTQGSPSGQGLAGNAVLGARSTSTANAFRGSMDEVAFFEGVVTQDDVDALREAADTQ